jgi:hypothetical protein
VTLVTVQTSPTRQLNSSAAASYRRMRTDGLAYGGINSAYRSIASQEQIFFARYDRVNYRTNVWYDGDYWKHVYGLPVAVPGTSAHNKGRAIDVSPNTVQGQWLLKHGARHGWFRPIPQSDPVHWEYFYDKDQDRRDQVSARYKVRAAQKALHVPQTGVGDAATIKAARAVESANDSPATFPYGKKYAQTHVGTRADGIWGPASKSATTKTVKAFQTAIGAKADGDWGTATGAIWASLLKKAK